jgi:predicted nucleic acid-binding protein
VDASALVKRYVNEPGSDWLRAIVTSSEPPLFFTSRMTIVEVISAFARRVRDDSLSSDEFTALGDAFRSDCLNRYQIMPPTLEIVDLACSLLVRHPLRAYDATQLATGLVAQKFLIAQNYPLLMFLSSDDRLNQAASREGLAVDNPGHHA